MFAGLAVLGALAIASSVFVSPARGGLSAPKAMPGPTRRARADERLQRNRECVNCHAEIAAEWAESLHHRSFRDPMFQEAFARERRAAFCQGCHAPEADPRKTPDAARAELGVGCVSCHLVDDEILAGPSEDPSADAAIPHGLRRDPEFAGEQACARCHEFWFPSGGRGGHELLMQKTVSEHARSPARGESCQGCHMPPSSRGTGDPVHRGHGFAVAGEPSMLKAGARIEAERVDGADGVERVILRLEPRAVGHAFPSGDLFRRLVLRVGDLDERYLARHFGGQRIGGAAIKIELADDRVGVGRGPRVVEFELPAKLRGRPVPWSVVYQRVLDAPMGAEDQAEVWDETELASGEL